MLIRPSSLSLLVYRIGDTLEAAYGVDPLPIYEELGVDPRGPREPGDRQPNSVVTAMFDRAAEAAGDPAFGLVVGLRSEPQHFFVIGHAWLASATLAEAIGKLLRYEAILNSGHTDLGFERDGDLYVLSEAYPDPRDYPGKLRADNEIASLLKMCHVVRGKPLHPVRLDLFVDPDAHADINTDIDTGIYASLVQGPVIANDERNALWFRAEDVEASLPGSIPELVRASCHIADRYLASLDAARVAHQVRAQLVELLPGGSVDQENIAARLYRSTSTLQRQLQAEGTRYRDVLDATRRELAEAYLRDRRHSQSDTAFLLGFSDQGNFARAFKRWTGMSPGQFRKAARAAAA